MRNQAHSTYPESQPPSNVSPSPVRRLGVLGGTFDPPHIGHLVLADTARVELRLQRVLFAPVGQPPHKSRDRPSSIAHRVALVHAALADAGESVFQISRVDLDRPGPHYTVDALQLLQKDFPKADIWFLIGGDSLADLPKWRAPTQIITLARLGVLARPGYEPDLGALTTKLVEQHRAALTIDLRQRIDWLTGPSVSVSSTALRNRARQGLPLRFLVPPSVEAYVCEHDLYNEDHGA